MSTQLKCNKIVRKKGKKLTFFLINNKNIPFLYFLFKLGIIACKLIYKIITVTTEKEN